MKLLATDNTHSLIEEHTPFVAVLLATHNGVRYLHEQLQSILVQEGVRVRVFVSDDQSTDGTWERLQEWANEKTNVTLLTRGTFGSAAANFLRLLHDSPISEFEFVAFCDQDDVWLPTKLQRAVSCMNKGGCEGYSSDLIAFNDVNEKSWRVHKFGTARRLDYIFGGASAGCTYVLSTQAALIIRKFVAMAPKKEWSHDWLFYAVCRSWGGPLVFRQEIFGHVSPTCAKCLRSPNRLGGSYCKGSGYSFRLVSPSNIAEWAMPSENSCRTSRAIESGAA